MSTSLENVKILLDIDEFDDSKNGLLNLFIARAQDYTRDYCKIDEIPTGLNSVIEEMVVFQFRQRGVENTQSEGKGSLSQSFIKEYPLNIMNRLQSNARVKFL
ncbi:phage head-tail connector protein [Neobacillus sp. 3P2-tot-E-2]|uniref:phage head-tail connector protein n=1 Tax=Neobacillus sp. 3P2-tot-E-2 TaxID=3132212 RepID=UPI0039A22779